MAKLSPQDGLFARRLAGRNVEVRVPLIPGITDTEENVRGISRFVRDAGLKRG